MIDGTGMHTHSTHQRSQNDTSERHRLRRAAHEFATHDSIVLHALQADGAGATAGANELNRG